MIEEAINILVNAQRGEQIVDGIVLSHPDVVETLYLTPWYPGFRGRLPSGDIAVFEYIPMSVDKPSTVENLSQQFKVIIQDLNEDANNYIDQIPFDTEDSISFTSLSYVIDGYGDDLREIADGPYNVEVGEFSSEPEGVGFTAEPQATNNTKCGERGTIERTGGLYRQFT